MAERSAKQLGLSKADLPNSVIEVIATLSKSGFEAYLVGGGVRDTLLGLRPKDFDAVTDAKPHEIKDLFGKRCRVIGRRFQLAHVYSGRDMIEVATFRAPPSGDAHTTSDGMIVRDNVWGDIEQDFARRDFSINALYYQPIKGIVHDFCNALDDIKSRTLRLLGNAPVRIEEDPVRLLRALRFKAKLGFDFDKALSVQFHDDNWALLDQVSPHRLYDESQKMFTGGYLVPLLPLLFEYGAIRHLIIYPPAKPTALVNQVALNTDKRIAQGKSINPAFFYAALLWDNYLYQLDRNKQKNMPFQDAQLHAASKVIDRQRIKTAIPKFAEQFIRDIWLMQPKLANPRAKQIAQLAEHPRFRAAFDFLLLREQCDDVANPLSESTNGMGEWWQTYQTLSEKQKQRAIDDFANDSRRGSNKRSRGRNRNKDTDSLNNDNIDQQASLETRSSDVQKSDRHHQRSQDTPINKSNKRTRPSRGQEAHYARERAQLQKLSLGEVAGEQSVATAQPQPLFTINADKMAKQVPQQAAISTQPKVEQDAKSSKDKASMNSSSQSQAAQSKNSQAEAEQNKQNDSSASGSAADRAQASAKQSAPNQSNANRAESANRAENDTEQAKLQSVGNAAGNVARNVRLLPKEGPVPSQRRRRMPSSSITQAERLAGVSEVEAQEVVASKVAITEDSQVAAKPKPRPQRKTASQPASDASKKHSQTVETPVKANKSRTESRAAENEVEVKASNSDKASTKSSAQPPAKRSRKKTASKANETNVDSQEASLAETNLANDAVKSKKSASKPAVKARSNRAQAGQSQSSQSATANKARGTEEVSNTNERVPSTRRRRAPSSDKTVNERHRSDS